MTDEINLNCLFADVLDVVKANRFLVAAIIFVSTMVSAQFDATLSDTELQLADSLFALVMLYLELLLMITAMQHFDLFSVEFNSGWSALKWYLATFVFCILYYLFLMVGFFALIIPGLIFMVRWSVALPAMISEDMGVIKSLKRSWNLTAAHWQTACKLLVLVFLFFLFAAGLSILLYPENDPASWTSAVLVNFLISVGLVVFWLLTVSLYRRILAQSQN